MTGPILKLTRAENKQSVYVNFALVQTFETYPLRGSLMFTMNDGTSVEVTETPQEITDRLEETDTVYVGLYT